MENKNMVSREEYLNIRQIAIQDAAKIKDKLISATDKYEYACKGALAMFDNLADEKAVIYINNFMLIDQKEFIEMVSKLNRNIKQIAEYFNIVEKIVPGMGLEIKKYYEYLVPQKATNNMGESSNISGNREAHDTVVEKKLGAPDNSDIVNTSIDVDQELEYKKKLLMENSLLRDENQRLSSDKIRLQDTISKQANEIENLKNRLNAINQVLPIILDAVHGKENITKER